MEKFQITAQGYKKLKAQLEKLKNEDRPNVIKQIATARELGDLRENSEYHSAKDRQGFIEAQIADYEDKFIRAEVVSTDDLIAAGSWATAREQAKVRTEGKDYIVKDGDVMIFLHG